MKKILLTAAIILAAVVCGNAESRTFVREYYYQAGESDSKITSRTKALTEVKRLLLEEIGVYLESYINYSEEQDGDRISNQFLKKEIEQISAGITETTILEENWTGIEYYIKAEITVDPEDVVRRLNRSIEQRKASVVVDSLNMLLTEANTSIKAKESEIASLRQSLENEQEKLRQQEENLQRLNKELSGLKSKYTQVAQQEQAVRHEKEQDGIVRHFTERHLHLPREQGSRQERKRHQEIQQRHQQRHQRRKEPCREIEGGLVAEQATGICGQEEERTDERHDGRIEEIITQRLPNDGEQKPFEQCQKSTATAHARIVRGVLRRHRPSSVSVPFPVSPLPPPFSAFPLLSSFHGR